MDKRSERVQRRFDVPVMVAALLTIPLIVIEESDYGQPWDGIGVALNWGTWLVFLAEIVVMLCVVPDRKRWVRENPVAVGVTALTPPFLSVFAPLRLIRLLRLVRLGPLARRLFTTRGVQYTALLAVASALAAGEAFAAIEDRSAGNGVYWALTTMTTVGSDLFPTTTASKTLAIVLALVGVSFVAILTGAIAQRFLAPELEREVEEVEEELDATGEALLRDIRGVRVQLDRIEAAVLRSRGASSSSAPNGDPPRESP